MDKHGSGVAAFEKLVDRAAAEKFSMGMFNKIYTVGLFK